MGTRVEIEYCAPCGHLERAIETQWSILEHFGRKIDGVASKSGEGGLFDIRADGEEIYEDSRPLDLDRLVADLESRV